MLRRLGPVLVSVLLLPLAANGQTQTTAGIAGVVKDTSDAVLPGVTVEAASPVLIEKVRTAVTDGQGQYKILDLRPGTYTVTFTLTGFSTVVREGIELTTGFSATVNGAMPVGSLEETITVTGASPVVDTQTVRQQTVLSRDLLDTVPTSKNLSAFMSLIAGASSAGATGVVQDVGGNQGEPFVQISIHGSRGSDQELMLDGMRFGQVAGASGGIRMMTINQVSATEINISMGSNNAEAKTGGAQINVIPKEGGNRLTMYGLGNYTNRHLQSDNLSDELRARGLSFSPQTQYIFDGGFGLGGPFRRDKLWFYTGHRFWGASEDVNTYFNATQGTPFYTQDLSRRGYIENTFQDHNVRLTWQASEKNKFNSFVSGWNNCLCYNTLGVANVSPEAARRVESRGWIAQGTWNRPVSNRMFLEAGVSYGHIPALQQATDPTITRDLIAITELSTGLTYNANGTCCGATNSPGLLNGDPFSQRFSVTYVTGSHALKVGVYNEFLYYLNEARVNNHDLTYAFRNQAPSAITQWASPIRENDRFNEIAFYGQDQWTIKRMTLNLGGRFQVARGWTPAYEVAAGNFAPARQIPEQTGIPAWQDFTPRAGVAYDLFGNGKTAVKGFVGKFLIAHGQDIVAGNNILNLQPVNAGRTWGDSDRDFIPDCDLTSTIANGECGPSSINSFGTPVTVRRYDPELLSGFGAREYNWQGSLSVTQELRPGWAVSVGYYRTWYGDLIATDNLAVSAADYSEYCVTVPVDARLPSDVSGRHLCGLYDVSPTKFGQTNQLVTNSSTIAAIEEVYNGVDVAMNGRFRNGHLGIGLSTGRGVTDNCAITAIAPEISAAGISREFCQADTVQSLVDAFQVKMNAAYQLPWWGIDVSGVLQNLPGIPVNATRSFTNDEIAPSLGRNLAACGTQVPCTSTVSLQVTTPGTVFEDRLTQIDLKLGKTFRFRSTRLRPSVSFFNLLNANTVLQVTPVVGPAYLVPRSILAGRIVKFELQLDM